MSGVTLRPVGPPAGPLRVRILSCPDILLSMTTPEGAMSNRSVVRPEATAESAFERLYVDHHRAVLAYCTRSASRADAWDAASEVFIVAWRRLDEVPPSEEARPWLLGVAFRVLANQRRGLRRRARLFERTAGSGLERPSWPEEQLIGSPASADVADALERLSPTDQEILRLTTWEGLSPVEIASVLGISRNAVDQRFSRAKRRLARQLTKNPEFSRWSEKGSLA